MFRYPLYTFYPTAMQIFNSKSTWLKSTAAFQEYICGPSKIQWWSTASAVNSSESPVCLFPISCFTLLVCPALVLMWTHSQICIRLLKSVQVRDPLPHTCVQCSSLSVLEIMTESSWHTEQQDLPDVTILTLNQASDCKFGCSFSVLWSTVQHRQLSKEASGSS